MTMEKISIFNSKGQRRTVDELIKDLVKTVNILVEEINNVEKFLGSKQRGNQ